MKAQPEFRPITEPYLYGYTATMDGRKAEVVRCYQSEWCVYTYTNGVMNRTPGTANTTYARAMSEALAFFRRSTK